jgi:hypothetical protein
MSEFLIEKDVFVSGIGNTIEIATGELIYSVSFSENIDATPEVLSRLPPLTPPAVYPKKIPAMWFVLNLKTNEVPYKVGSKWKLKIQTNGTISLAEVK